MLIFCDSFDGYTSLASKGWISDAINGNTALIGATALRTGIAGLWMKNDSFGNNCQVYRDFTAAGEVVVGFAYSRASLGAKTYVVELRDGGTVHLRLGIDSSNHLVVYRGPGSTLLGTGTTTVPASAFVYIEIRAKIHDTTGTVTVRMNGANEIALTGQDTQNAGASQVSRIYFNNDFVLQLIDDLYVCDVTGSSANDLLGDIKVECLRPNGNGNSSQFVGNDGNSTDNYLLVDDPAPNDDTDYVQASTVGDKDTYAYGNLVTTTGTVHAVQLSAYARKSDAGARKFTQVARLSTTEEDSAAENTLITTYQYFTEVRHTKPGGGAWSVSDVNSAEFGVKVST